MRIHVGNFSVMYLFLCSNFRNIVFFNMSMAVVKCLMLLSPVPDVRCWFSWHAFLPSCSFAAIEYNR